MAATFQFYLVSKICTFVCTFRPGLTNGMVVNLSSYTVAVSHCNYAQWQNSRVDTDKWPTQQRILKILHPQGPACFLLLYHFRLPLTTYMYMYMRVQTIHYMYMYSGAPLEWIPLEPTISPLQRGVSNPGASGIFPVGVVCVIRLLSTTWPCFQSFPLLYAGGEGQAEASKWVTALV